MLSGGGIRGLAHVGVLKALAEEGVRPEAVSGTSSGAIVGALFGAGYSAEEMLEFFVEKSPFRLSKLALGKPGFFDTAKVYDDFREYFPDDSFESLSLPLFVTATDLVEARRVVFSSGPLIRPVLASSSVPFVFTPTEIDGRLYADGGILDNFPVDPLSDLCDLRIGSYASPLRDVDRKSLTSTISVSQRSFEIGMHSASRRRFGECDLVVCPPELARFTPFETKAMRECLDIGYRAARARMSEIRELVGRAK
ncbi:MAG: patatin-like phospholipase family protein [Acidobacteria bacterium]|nr:patatin-like phospholipase family protein [Acidobacteriota bacterium]